MGRGYGGEQRGDSEEACLGQESRGTGAPSLLLRRLWASHRDSQVATDARRVSVLPPPGWAWMGKFCFSNLIVVFQLQKEMRKGVCAHLCVSSHPNVHIALHM